MCTRTFTGLRRYSRYLFKPNFRTQNSLRLWMSTTKADGQTEEALENGSQESGDQLKQSDVEKTFNEEKKKLEANLQDMKDKYMRSLAEAENVRQRMKKQTEEAKLFGIQGLCKDLLEVADILNAATDSVPKDEITNSNPHLKNLYEGLVMTESQMQKVFTKHKLVKISPVEGDKFNPHFHEALFEVPMEGKEAGAVAVMQKIGYKLHERTLRPAIVGVYKTS